MAISSGIHLAVNIAYVHYEAYIHIQLKGFMPGALDKI